jgi:chromosomal replication initiator protein
MTVELEKPDFDLRRKFLAMKAAQDGLNISSEVLDFIATHVTDSVRELEGIMVALLAHATVLDQDITIDLARSVIGNTVKVTHRQVTFETIAETVADFYNLPTELIYGKSRKREISDARQLVMYLAKKEAQMSSPSIGAKLDRTHATVLHACIQIEQRMSIEKDFSREVQAITASLTQ